MSYVLRITFPHGTKFNKTLHSFWIDITVNPSHLIAPSAQQSVAYPAGNGALYFSDMGRAHLECDLHRCGVDVF